MALNSIPDLVSSFFKNTPISFVNAVTGSKCWTGLKSVSVEILSDSEVTNEPMFSSGATINDIAADLRAVKVITPAKATITAIAPDPTALAAVLATFKDPLSIVNATFKSVTMLNLAITDIEIVQEPERLSSTKIVISMEQSEKNNNNPSYKAEQAQDISSYGAGIKQPSALSTSITNFSSKIKSSI